VVPVDFTDIYLWIDQVPLSRPKKSIARDFSDCGLVAELVKHFQPRLVEVHNYPPASNPKAKVSNWNTLNKRVLSRLQIALSQEQIEDLVAAKPGRIERFFAMLKPKLEAYRHEPTAGHVSGFPAKPKNLGYSELNSPQKLLGVENIHPNFAKHPEMMRAVSPDGRHLQQIPKYFEAPMHQGFSLDHRWNH